MACEQAQPPASLYPGAVDLDNGCVSFALYAPGKHSVHVIGNFNDWNYQSHPLHATPAGLWWTVLELPPGIYDYQFVVDGEIVICDPYARALCEDAEYDPPRAVVEVGRTAHYEWQHDGWTRPSYNDLIIYEIHVGDFTPQGTLRGLIERLPYLADLGINAIELMPIFEFKGDLGWGYNPAYFFTVEKSYGEPDEMRQLVDQAHAHGIAVILDMVLAHTAHRHPYNKLYPYQESPWYGRGCGEVNQFGFPSLDYTKGPAQDFVRDVQNYWFEQFHIDGFRYDYCHGIGCRDGMGMPFLIHHARAARNDAYLVAEYSPEKPDDVNLCALDGAWHVGASYGIKALLCECEQIGYNGADFAHCVEVLDPHVYGYQRAAQMVNYLESHDEQRLMWDLQCQGFDEPTRYAKAALGATMLLTMPGVPMLYHGQEWGEGTERKTNERNTIHWEHREQGAGKALYEHYRRLCHLRREHVALRDEGYMLDRLDEGQKTLVYHRWHDAGDEVVVAANFGGQAHTVSVPFPRPARWLDVVTGDSLVVEGEAQVELPAFGAGVWVKG